MLYRSCHPLLLSIVHIHILPLSSHVLPFHSGPSHSCCSFVRSFVRSFVCGFMSSSSSDLQPSRLSSFAPAAATAAAADSTGSHDWRGGSDSFEYASSEADDDYQLIEPATMPAPTSTSATDSGTTTAVEERQLQQRGEGAEEDDDELEWVHSSRLLGAAGSQLEPQSGPTAVTSDDAVPMASPAAQSTSSPLTGSTNQLSPLRHPSSSPRSLPAYSPLSIPLSLHPATATAASSTATATQPTSAAFPDLQLSPSSSSLDEPSAVPPSSQLLSAPSACTVGVYRSPSLLPYLSPSFLRGGCVVVGVILLLGLVKLTCHSCYRTEAAHPSFSVS